MMYIQTVIWHTLLKILVITHGLLELRSFTLQISISAFKISQYTDIVTPCHSPVASLYVELFKISQ